MNRGERWVGLRNEAVIAAQSLGGRGELDGERSQWQAPIAESISRLFAHLTLLIICAFNVIICAFLPH
jgi:hypothetical protein